VPLAAVLSLGIASDPNVSLFLAVSGTLGLALGALLGAATPRLVAWRLGRVPRIAFLGIGGVVGGLCGLLVGGIAGVAAMRGPEGSLLGLLAAPFGALQLGWFWVAATQRRVRHRPVGGMLAAAAVAGPLMALGVMHFIR
jgi:hypothetical protein